MEKQQKSMVTRRGFLAAGGACVVMVGIGGYGAVSEEVQTPYVRPPGTESDADLVSRCNRCGRCYQACPYNIISPISLGDSIIAYGTPVLDFSIGYCDWCMLCLEACPTGALRWGTPTESNIGVAKVLSDACVAWNWVGCTVCVDECPVEGAIVLDEQGRPAVNEDLCDGCGRCEQVCPSASLRSYDPSLEEKGIFVVSRLSKVAESNGAILGSLYKEEAHKPRGVSHEDA